MIAEDGDLTDRIQLIDLKKPVRQDFCKRPAEYHLRPRHLSVAELKIAEFRLGCDTKAYAKVVQGLLVGENPGRSTHPDLPLFPWPDNSSAGRLLAMSKMTAGQYLGGLYRRNLCYDRKWSREEAERTARLLVTTLFDMPRTLRVVLCGTKVAKAFGLGVEFWAPFKLESGQRAVVVPHPSGLNRVYNERTAREETGRYVRWAALGEEVQP